MKQSRLHDAATTTSEKKPVKLGEKIHPLYTAPWLSRLTWWWMFPLLFTGRRKQLDEDDVWELPQSMRARSIHDRYAERCRKYPDMSLRQHLMRMFWPRWVLAGICYVGWCVCAGAQPFLVSAIVSHLQDDDADTSKGAWLAFALFVSTLWYVARVASFSTRHHASVVHFTRVCRREKQLVSRQAIKSLMLLL